jgi:RHS repeat-associated protein
VGDLNLHGDFAYGTLSLANNTYVRLVDQNRNSSGTAPEALYVNTLVVPAGCTLDLNGFHVYAQTVTVSGTLPNGLPVLITDLTPHITWLSRDPLLHGTETLAWEAPLSSLANVTAALSASNGRQTYAIAVGQPALGTFAWDTTGLPDGSYQLTATFYDAAGNDVGQLSRQVAINNSAVYEAGLITTDTTWTNAQVHVVTGTVTVASGAHLTIQPGAIVKFAAGENLQLIIESGGTLNAQATQASPIILTSLDDDTAGGDTNLDGGQTTPQSDDWHGLLLNSGGTENLTSYIQQRYSLLDVACVPWEGLNLSHETINGASTLLAGEAENDQFPLTYTWNFGDGSALQSGTAATQAAAYAIATNHVYPTSGPGTPYLATLTVTDPSGNSSSSQYPILVESDTLSVETDIAIDKGLWWLHTQIQRSVSSGVNLGDWSEEGYSVFLTGLAILAMENNGHLPTGNPAKDPYVEDVTRGLNYLFTQMVVVPISEDPSLCPYGNPDTSGDGVGIRINSSRYTYEIGPAMMAIAASTTPNAVAPTGPAMVIGRTYKQILTDMVDMCAWGQDDTGTGRGGWRYNWNYGDSDNSVTQWPIFGMEAAEDDFGIQPPSFVARELQLWLTYSQSSDGGWGYTDPNNGTDGMAHVGTGIAGLSFCGFPSSDSRIQAGLSYMAANWNAATYGGETIWNSKYSMYAVAKGLRTASPAITMVGTQDWYADFSQSLIAGQNANGSWPYTTGSFSSGQQMDSAFSLLVLEPSVLSRPPIAVLTATPLAARPGQVFTFDASASYDLDPARKIVEYVFNFGDGTTYTMTPSNAPNGDFNGITTHVYPDTIAALEALPNQQHNYTVTVTVWDDNPLGAESDEATQTVTLSLQNHPPVSVPGGPYFGFVGLPVTFSGIGSYAPDAGSPLYNHIAAYGWQFTGATPYTFSDATTMAAQWTWNAPGTYNVGLEVTNRFGLTGIAWTTVTIVTGVPTQLAVRSDLEGEYGAPIDLMAQLTTPALVPIAGMPIDFYVDRNRDGSFDPVTEFAGEVTTDATGWATFPYQQIIDPDDGNPYGIEATFAGQGDYFASSGQNYLEVDPGRTAIVYTGATAGGVGQTVQLSASLTDYEGAVLAGQPVTFTLDSQSVTAQTDAHGLAAASLIVSQASTSTVSVSYGGEDDYEPASDASPFTVSQTVPVLLPIPDQSIEEGATLTLIPSFVDPALGQNNTVTIDWRDGSPAESFTLANNERAATASHVFAEEGLYVAKITVSNDDGSDTKLVRIAVGDPAVVPSGGFALQAATGQLFGNQTVATFVDPGGAEPVSGNHYSAMIDWGDNSNSAGTIALSGSVFTVEGSHAYSAGGTYTITTTIFHESAAPATAVSTATVKGYAGLLLLDPVSPGALTDAGSGSVDVNGYGDIVVNSSDPQAAALAANGNLSANTIEVTGGVVTSGSGQFLGAISHQTPTSDPLALLLPPAPLPIMISSVKYSGSSPITLRPGTYNGGITVTGGGSLTLLPGIYYMNGGGFSVTGSGSVTGLGVMIVNAPKKAGDTINFGGQGAVTLTPPASLPAPYAAYAGITIFQNPASNAPINFASQSGGVNIQGVVYAPKSVLSVTAQADTVINPRVTDGVAQVIAYGLRMTGSGNFVVNCADTAKPVVTVSNLVTSNRKPTLSGMVAATMGGNGIAGVSVVVGGQTLAATVTGNRWSVVVPVALADGTYDVQATATDTAGNIGSDSTSNELTVDSVAPLVTVDSLATSDSSPVLSGTVSDASPSSGIASVSVVVGGQTLTATVAGNTWCVAVPAALADGTYNVQATARDLAGNAGSDTTTNELTVSAAAPVVTVAALVTNKTMPTLRGTVSASPASGGITGVTVVVGGQTLAATVTGNTWSVAVPVPLADGTYNLQATATDATGNTGSNANELTVDTVAPAATVASYVVNSATPTLHGLVIEPSPSSGIAGVQVTIDGQTLTATLNGRDWSANVPTPLPDGTYTVVATATDNAGNSGTLVPDSPDYCTSYQIIVDTHSPSVTVAKLVTNHSLPTLTGTVNDPAPSSGITGVTVAVGGETAAAILSGGTWSAMLPVALADGTYDVQATATDSCGNTTTDTATKDLTVYTGQPLVTVNPLVTNNNQPLLSGTVSSLSPSEGIAEVEILVGNQTLMATITGNVWDVVPAKLADGTYDVEAIAFDAAGNKTIDDATNALTVDTVAPLATVTPLATNNVEPTVTGTVTDPSPGSGVASMLVSVGIAPQNQNLVATMNGSTWFVTVPVALADGTYNVQTTATDRAGNSSTDTTTNVLVIDTVKPQVGMTPLVANSNQPLLSGTVSDAAPSSGIASVTLLVGGESFAAKVAANTWSVTVPQPLADGTYNVSVTATDNAGNAITDTVTGGLIIDTVKPTVAVNVLVTNNAKPALSGTVTDAAPSSGIASVTLVVNEQTFTAIVSGNTWTATIPAAISDGIYNVQATATDNAGNSAAYIATNALTIDTVKPVVAVSPLATNVNTPTLYGAVADPLPSSGIASVSVLVAGQSVVASVNGNGWSAALPVALADGTYNVLATATDNAGNSFSTTALNALIVDTVAPQLTIAKLVTNSSTPTLSGTVSDAAPSSGIASVSVLVGTQRLSATLTNGAWSVAVPAALADGTYDIQATAADNAGNSTGLTATGGLVIDTVKPVVSVDALITNNNKPTLTGAVSDAAPSSGLVGVTVVVAGQTLAATVTGSTWSVNVPTALADGTYSVQATASDNAGNTASDTTSNGLIVDTVAPLPAVTSMLSGSLTPMLSGTVTDASPSSGIAGVTVIVGGQTLAAAVTGNNWTAAVTPPLAAGTYDVTVAAADRAGNSGSTTVTGALVVDTSLPLISVASLVTNKSQPTLSGSVAAQSPGDPVTSVSVFVGGQTIPASVNGTIWTATAPTALSDGSYIVTATATDANGKQVSASNALTVDTVSPVITVNPLITSNDTPTLTGTVSDAAPSSGIAGVTVAVNGQALAVQLSGGNWTAIVAAPLPDGTYNVSAAATDNAGNVGLKTTSNELTIDASKPVLAAIADQVVNVGQTLSLTASASDPQVPPGHLTFSLDAGPQGAAIDPLSGVITWTAPSTVEVVGMTVRVTSPAGLYATTSFQVTVAQPLALNVSLGTNPVDLGAAVTITLTASDNVPITSTTVTVAGTAVVLTPTAQEDTWQATWTATAGGRLAVLGTAVDTLGRTTTQEVDLLVRDPSDTHFPQVAISSPAMGQMVTYLTDIVGSVQDPTLASWQVDYARADLVDTNDLADPNPNFVVLASGTDNVDNQKLATFDPTLLADDSYVIRLLAENINGRISAVGVAVGVSGAAKLGNFHMEVTDLSVPLSGIPIQINRTYDTLNANVQGSFGYGWDLGLEDADILETVPAGQSFQIGTRVYLTDPAGNRVGFTFTPTVVGSIFGAYWIPEFTPDPGVYDKLAVYDTIAGPPGSIWAGIGGVYNPDKYKLTTPDGTLYEYDQYAGLQKVTETDGVTLTFTPDGITSSTGVSIPFHRDSQGRVIEIDDPSGNAIKYQYDSAGNLISVSQPVSATSSEVTQYTYLATPAHFLSTIIDPNGVQTFKAQFDASGRLISSTDGTGATVSQSFDLAAMTGTQTDANGNVTTLIYNSRGDVVEKEDPPVKNVITGEVDNYVTTYVYGDPNNPDLPTKVTDRRGFVTTYTYDTNGNETSVGTPGYDYHQYTYDAQNDLTSILQVSSGQDTTLQYDSAGHLTKVVDAAGDSATSVYDAQGRLVSQTDFDGNTTTYAYPANVAASDLALPTWTYYPNGTSDYKEYDSLGNVVFEINADGVETLTTRDDQGRAIVQITGKNLRTALDPQQATCTEWVYNGQFLASETIVDLADPTKDRTTQYQYDAAGRLLRETDADGGVTTYTYDSAGNQTSVTDPDGNTTTFQYDSRNELVTETDPLGNSTFYAYDGEGNQTEIVDRDGRERTFTFTGSNQPQTETWWNGTIPVETITWSYDTAANLQSITDGSTTYAYTYDVLDRVTSVDNAGSVDMPHVVLYYTYDKQGNVTSVKDNLGVEVDSTYNSQNLLASDAWQGTGIDPASVDFLYTGTGLLEQVGRYSGTAQDTLVGTTDYTYGPTGQVSDVTYRNAVDAVLADLQYQYDFGGLVSTETYTDADSQYNRVANYTYDPAGQLLSAAYSNGQAAEQYSYDANGNRIGSGYVTGKANQLLSDGTFNYLYDKDGNLVMETEIATGEVTTFDYDFRNRMTSATQWSKDPSQGGVILHEDDYRYDVLDRRIEITSDGQVTKTVYNGENAWADFNADGTIKARYLFGNTIDQALAIYAPGVGTCWYQTDRLGTVRQIIGPTGQVINRIVYAAFGQVISQTNSTLPNRFLFTGRELSFQSGLYYYRARFFDPTAGRFISQDPLRFSAGDLNLFRYGKNSPTTTTDPTGMLEIGEGLFLIGISTTISFGFGWANGHPTEGALIGLAGGIIAVMLAPAVVTAAGLDLLLGTEAAAGTFSGILTALLAQMGVFEQIPPFLKDQVLEHLFEILAKL